MYRVILSYQATHQIWMNRPLHDPFSNWLKTVVIHGLDELGLPPKLRKPSWNTNKSHEVPLNFIKSPFLLVKSHKISLTSAYSLWMAAGSTGVQLRPVRWRRGNLNSPCLVVLSCRWWDVWALQGGLDLPDGMGILMGMMLCCDMD